jgi:adenosylcobinamide-phosphate synthase
MSLAWKIVIAYFLDLIFGDPYRIPHPVQFIGKLISGLEKRLIGYKNKRFSGAILNIIVLTVTYTVSYFLSKNIFLEIYLMYTIFSTRCLANEGKKVFKILKSNDLDKARRELSYLVSRDTKSMKPRDIVRSTMETISENMVDGIVAPMFFMFLGGMPLAMTYKAINTMDSMLGYKNEKYKDFGWFSAKLDDAVNLLPARITGAILIPVSSLVCGYDFKSSIRVFFRDRLNHASPNSAHPESSVAGAIGVQFGGSTSYFGILHDKPTIGDKVKEFEIGDILKNIKLMYVSSLFGLLLFEAVYFITL